MCEALRILIFVAHIIKFNTDGTILNSDMGKFIKILDETENTDGYLVHNLDNIATKYPRLNLAVHGNGDFSIGTATYEESNRLGKIWVGKMRYKLVVDGQVLMALDIIDHQQKKSQNLQLQVSKQILKLLPLMQMVSEKN